ncbi:MAG: calcium/sodium antiporter [Pirellulales bacterium]|nr:calcium/sodium antiporter [Pirellulales bacterium]
MWGAALFIWGLVVLIVGAELVVRGGAALAASLGVKPLILGLTVVAIGTSFPELAVGITACVQGSGAIAVGNIAGTNLLNILFILGLSALLRPLPLHLQVFKLELPVMVVAATMMTVLAFDGILSRLDGALMLTAAGFYTVALVRLSRQESRNTAKEFQEQFGVEPSEVVQPSRRVRIKFATILGIGIVLSILGADWLVGGAVSIAHSFGVSDAMIGLTIVAVGTSAPEFVTTVVATIKNERDIAVGNLLGSSIYNILVILAITCLASPQPIPVEPQLLFFDIPIMAAVALLCIPVFITGRSVSRFEGGMFVTIYLLYMVALLQFHT